MTKIKKAQFNNGWCFAIVNNRLVEIHFDKRYGVWGHCYVKRKDYKTKQEWKWIEDDTKKYRFSYRKGYYFDKIRGIKQKVPAKSRIFPKFDRKKLITLESLEKKLNLKR